ncbi:hypothetical protein ACYUJ6_08845 [Clostridium sp. JNZ X4-2]
MNTISDNQSTINWYQQIKNAQEQSQIYNNKKKEQDSAIFGQQGIENLNSIQGIQETSNNSVTNSLNALVSSGTITQSQEDAVGNAFQAAFQANRTNAGTYNKVTNPLDNLVSNGTITQDQKDTIKDALKTSFHNSHQVHKNSDSGLNNSLDSMVSDGTITQDQEDAIKSALQSAFQTTESKKGRSSGLEDILDSLVSNATITQDQENTIQNIFNSGEQFQFQ